MEGCTIVVVIGASCANPLTSPPGTFRTPEVPDVPWRPLLTLAPPSPLYKDHGLTSEATCYPAFDELTSLLFFDNQKTPELNQRWPWWSRWLRTSGPPRTSPPASWRGCARCFPRGGRPRARGRRRRTGGPSLRWSLTPSTTSRPCRRSSTKAESEHAEASTSKAVITGKQEFKRI